MTSEQFCEESKKLDRKYEALREKYFKSLAKKAPVNWGDVVWLTNTKLNRTFVCEVQNLQLEDGLFSTSAPRLIIRLRRLYKNGNLGQRIDVGTTIPYSAMKRVRANQDPFGVPISNCDIPKYWEDWNEQHQPR